MVDMTVAGDFSLKKLVGGGGASSWLFFWISNNKNLWIFGGHSGPQFTFKTMFT